MVKKIKFKKCITKGKNSVNELAIVNHSKLSNILLNIPYVCIQYILCMQYYTIDTSFNIMYIYNSYIMVGASLARRV